MIYNFLKGIGSIFVLALVVWCTGCSGSDGSSTPETVLKNDNLAFIKSVFPHGGILGKYFSDCCDQSELHRNGHVEPGPFPQRSCRLSGFLRERVCRKEQTGTGGFSCQCVP